MCVEATIVESEIALAHFLDGVGRPRLDGAAICGAGSLLGEEQLQFSHDDLLIDARRLAAEAACPVRLLSVFDAVARSLPAIPADELLSLRAGQAVSGAPRLVIGIGAELDIAAVTQQGDAVHVLGGECGEFDLAPIDDDELTVWLALRQTLGRVSADTLFTPAGLLALHRARSCAARSPELLIRDALAGEVQPRLSISIYSRWFGRMLGKLALLTGARGGVYVSGSVVPGGLEWFDVTAFCTGFDEHAATRPSLGGIPLYAITHPQPALLGCAVFASAGIPTAPSPAAASSAPLA
ncbi:MAG: glucokinase [Solimonas sp.]